MRSLLCRRTLGNARCASVTSGAPYPPLGCFFLLSPPLVDTVPSVMQRRCRHATASISAGSCWTAECVIALTLSHFTKAFRWRENRVLALTGKERFGGLLIRDCSSASENAPAISLLWEQYFSDPSQWRDHRLTKNNPSYPDFRHRRSQEVLWVNNWGNPPWVVEELGTPLHDMCVYGGHPYDRDVGRLCHEGRITEALQALDLMWERGIQPIPDTYACVLQECSRQNTLSEGRHVHDLILKTGLMSNKYLQRHLISMYGSCESMTEARKVFASILERHVFAWAALIRGYLSAKQYKQVINCFHQMRSEGSNLNKLVYFYILTACAKLAALAEGKEVHALIAESGYSAELLLETALQNMYIKCGNIQDARSVFDKMWKRDVVTWNSMMNAYAENGQMEEAVTLFQLMQSEGVKPDSVTLVCILKACTGVESLRDTGKWVHGLVLGSEYEKHAQVGAALITMYFRWGHSSDAKIVFEKMPKQHIVPWTAMINGCVQQGYCQEALNIFQELQDEGVELDSMSLLTVLGACSSTRFLEEGRKVHALIVERGFESDVFLGPALVTMFAKCGSLEDARQVFDKTPTRGLVLWNAMLAAYAKHRLGNEALKLFEEMNAEGVKPDKVTFISLFNACSDVAYLDAGRQAHLLFVKSTILPDIRLENSILNMYAKCSQIEDAQRVFNGMSKPDVVAWTTMIKAYVQHGQGEDAVKLLEQLQHEDVQLDTVFYVSVLGGCTSLRAGRVIHSHAVKSYGKLDVSVANALLNMYSTCGSLNDAQRVFGKMPKQDVVSWTSMINAYLQHGQFEEAFDLFKDMEYKGVKPNKVSYLCALNVCGSIPDLEKGRYIHSLIAKSEYVEDTSICNALVDMYAKCGTIGEAKQVFDGIFSRDLVSWNTMILACSSHLGFQREALALFGRMEESSCKPNHITFKGVLMACCHLNLVDEGCQYFDSMIGKYCIPATDDHSTNIVYLLGRSGRLGDAKEFVSSLPYKPGSSVWKALLDVARHHGDTELAKHASYRITEQAFQASG